MSATPSTSGHSHGSDTLRTVVLVLATLTTGLTASVFVHWSNTIMPGLSDLDDRGFVEAQRELDTAIRNPLFLGVEVTGALLLLVLAVVLLARAGQRRAVVLVGVALACHVAMLMITFGVHEPLNQELFPSGGIESDADFAAVRDRFDESAWAAWNAVRAVASTIAFGGVAVALAIHRRNAQLPAASSSPIPRSPSMS